MTLILGQEQTRNVAQYTQHHMICVPAKSETVMSNGSGEMHLQEIFDLTLIQDQGHIKHCTLHHVTYVPAKCATANG